MNETDKSPWELFQEDGFKKKAEKEVLDLSKLPKLERGLDGVLSLQGREVELFPCCPPEFVQSIGYSNVFLAEKQGFLRETFYKIEQRRLEVGADCYEVGDVLFTWSGDSGYGARYQNHPVQFYKVLAQK